MNTSRPGTTRPRPVAPQPRWEGLFLEPIFADVLPGQNDAGEHLEDEDHAAA